LHPNKLALQWYEHGIPTKSALTYSELWLYIDFCAAEIKRNIFWGEKPNPLIILLCEPGLLFFVHFYACLRVGLIPIPYYPPSPADTQRGINLLSKVIQVTDCFLILCSSSISQLKRWKGKWPKVTPKGVKIQYFTLKFPSSNDLLPGKNCNFESTMPSADQLAFLQFTSGSTSDPKGVMIGHDNFQYHCLRSAFFLLANTEVTSHGSLFNPNNVISTSWLPQYHDMGLALSVTTTLVIGGTIHIMSPLEFLKDPLLWFDIMSSSRSTHSVAPNFAYGLVTRKWDKARAEKWNLSSLRMLGNSAEPILLATVKGFLEKMKEDVPSFDRDKAYLTGYGIAGTFPYFI
jgi:acyl-CoA synthetase (AMP-forming)/AMP-acid ligase II